MANFFDNITSKATSFLGDYASKAGNSIGDKVVGQIQTQASELAKNPYVKTTSIILSVAFGIFGFYFLIRLINELFTLRKNL
ncbi:hypothetical protein BKH41_00725 [Helicobacter sp. 12S02232-10]|uniref:hypothetical protein n=1 Tax=Helicobacter sp. 12S02232-10 TaxID=1476197 RepID=UPI000BA6C0D1|nr:hypothetical protein [Helicobacter sp. 12S02232-10]PAF49859.1 hypothetical protein BKH41_00725 [Helicobacter sp. 12S02232-10]